MIKALEIELTTRCNAKCAVCPRFFNNSENPYLGKHDLDPEILETNINEKIWESIEIVTLKGTVGDALFHPNLDKILSILYNKKCKVELITNGSAKSKDWWMELAKTWKDRITVTFCLDGVDEETHFLYRKTNFNKVLENALSFISNNGSATWFMIAFKHNQNQIKNAKNMAKKLGFKKFESIFSERYDENNQSTQAPILDEQDMEMQFGDPKYKKLTFCPKIKKSSYYLASDGFVWPCCMYGSINLTTNRLFWNYFKKQFNGDIDKINLNTNKMDDILAHPIWVWWQQYVKTQPKKCLTYCGKLQDEI